MKVRELIIKKVKNLPTLPTVYSSLSNALNDKYASTQKVGGVISADQVSSFKVLKIANSPFFGFRGKVDTISQAIMYLGFNEIRNIIFSLAVMKYFKDDEKLNRFNFLDFWAHSIAVGIASRRIGQASGERKIENNFLSGILHDIGKLVLIEAIGSKYDEVLNYSHVKKCSISEAEKNTLGINHSEAGKIIAEIWELPKSIQETINTHHNPKKGSLVPKVNSAVHLGDIVARALELGNAGEKNIPEPDDSIWKTLNLPKDFFTANYETIKEDFNQTVSIMLVD